ncbi:MAG: thiol:disulfide interchange protein [candidate division Zixibacteria bacterium]|nr:thiol:disulfide interchange protein [candidate division Zixibacteria bacterium]
MRGKALITSKVIHLIVFLVAISAGLNNSPVKAEAVRVGHVEAELVSEVDEISPGQSIWVGLHLKMDDKWHVYWRNPGDAGLPPKINWDLPDGFEAGSITWPHPERIEVEPVTSFGYYREVLLPVRLTVPESIQIDDTVELKANPEWLVCKQVCIPGEAELSLRLPVSQDHPSYNTAWSDKFNQVRNNLPLKEHGWKISVSGDETGFSVELVKPQWFEADIGQINFFPYKQGVVDISSIQEMTTNDSGYVLLIDRNPNLKQIPDSLSGVLVSSSGWRGPDSEQAIEFVLPVTSDRPEAEALASINIWQALLFAFIGGMILNLMPCVLPVLSIKILGFVNQAGEERGKIFAHGLIFTAGVLLSFIALAVVLILLRAGGQELGWGFQLQSPGFLAGLSIFMFLFALNLLGVFEIGTSLTRLDAGQSSGWSGSFLNGVTATVVATPCTAPFMGSALGFSLSQPAWVSLSIFLFLGLGMAFPYLILSAFPRFLKLLPKPGRWMESLKQFMGFLLLATVIWLAWVLGVQAGVNSVAVLMIALLVSALGGWIYGRWGGQVSSSSARTVATLLAIVLILGSFGFSVSGVGLMAVDEGISYQFSGDGLDWLKFDPDHVAELIESGQPVFIDFTAAWCLSCQVNEKVAFGSEEVRQRIADLGVTTFKADWTRRDDTITRALAEYGRNSVPLYVLHTNDGEEIILPEIITPEIVLDALNKIDS